jgi:hypothetical protein
MGSNVLTRNFAAQQNLVSATMCEVRYQDQHVVLDPAILHFQGSVAEGWKEGG